MPGNVAFSWTKEYLSKRLQSAVKSYWLSRKGQSSKQKKPNADSNRGEVTGGKHLNELLKLLQDIILEAGIKNDEVLLSRGIELPGYFRAQKRWDIVVVRNGRLCAAIELKSQAGSFGKNLNNRSEEAIGSSTDFWTAFREGALGKETPWLGYLFLLEDAKESTRPVGLKKSEFPAFPIFANTTYTRRYEILCERLVLERKYTKTALILAPRQNPGKYSEPNMALDFYGFAKSLHAHLLGCR